MKVSLNMWRCSFLQPWSSICPRFGSSPARLKTTSTPSKPGAMQNYNIYIFVLQQAWLINYIFVKFALLHISLLVLSCKRMRCNQQSLSSMCRKTHKKQVH